MTDRTELAKALRMAWSAFDDKWDIAPKSTRQAWLRAADAAIAHISAQPALRPLDAELRGEITDQLHVYGIARNNIMALIDSIGVPVVEPPTLTVSQVVAAWKMNAMKNYTGLAELIVGYSIILDPEPTPDESRVAESN